MPSQLNHLHNDGSEIDERRRAGLLAAEPGQAADDFARPAALRLEQRNFIQRRSTEARIALETILPRIPEWTVDDDNATLTLGIDTRGWQNLPVTVP